MWLLKNNLFLNLIQKSFFFTKLESYNSYNRVVYNIFGYVRTDPHEFECNKQLKLIFASFVSDIHWLL